MNKAIIVLSLLLINGLSYAGSITISIDMFSGRPSPSGIITDASIIDSVESAYEARGPERLDAQGWTPPYAGIYVETDGTSLPSAFIVYNGFISIVGNDGHISGNPYYDVNKSLENTIIVIAKSQGIISEMEEQLLLDLRSGEYNNNLSSNPNPI